MMITKVLGEQPFQVLTNNFSISPSTEGYTLQISADGVNYSNLFSVGAGVTRLVTGVAANSYYKLLGNESQVSVNWMKTCVTAGGGSASGNELVPQDSFPLDAEAGTVVALKDGGVYQYDGTDWNEIGSGDMSQYWTSAQTQSAITQAVSEVEDHLSDVEEVTSIALNDLNERVIEISGSTVDLSPYWTSAQTQSALTGYVSLDTLKYHNSFIDSALIRDFNYSGNTYAGAAFETVRFSTGGVTVGVPFVFDNINGKKILTNGLAAKNWDLPERNEVQTMIDTSLSGISSDVLRVSDSFESGDTVGDLRSIQNNSIWWNGTDVSDNIDLYISESYFTTLTGSGRTNSTYIGSIIYNNVASSNSSLHLYLEKTDKNYIYPDHEYYLMGYDGNGTTMDLYLPLDMNGVTGRTLSTSNVTYYFSNSYSDGLSHISFSGTGSNIGVLTNPLTIKEEGVYVKGASHNTRLIDEEIYESSTQAISVALNQLNNTKVSSEDIRNIVKMTQAEYDALSGDTSATTLYIITSN